MSDIEARIAASLERVEARLGRVEKQREQPGPVEWAHRAATAIVAGIVLASMSAVSDHGQRIASIESTRFTHQDAQQMERRLMNGPSWLRPTLDQIREDQRTGFAEAKASFASLDARLRDLERK